ncbi:hypothetical protein SVI_3191 [Shewanella violacea DSS12]|uniref:Uncharacterized protein n=1 Tax=Shewanella violacea (strain JCM 10179 / CIP 106290 / LMG 19151 / DSS12) TaxID=637905 RepID=D4ZAW7_SHEVD|nr:hypothetical protein SVI_3191 [Shewanella violacea DSS12]
MGRQNQALIVDAQVSILFGSYTRGEGVEDVSPDTLQFHYLFISIKILIIY